MHMGKNKQGGDLDSAIGSNKKYKQYKKIKTLSKHKKKQKVDNQRR